MLAKLLLKDEEREVDPRLGYPRGYAKLCRHAHHQVQGLITPFTEGPPQRFQPYAPPDEALLKLREFDSLFPTVDEEERDPTDARRHAEFLWQQLDHIGNAGFDPAKFRVDIYGNVLYWDADTGSPLAWAIDHWFPQSRGGQSLLSNLRIIQWQADHFKGTKLEFLVPWWDLQIGVSVSQFLSVFASRNADFRQRAFSHFFIAGENEQLDDHRLVVECHTWPQHFLERKKQVGLAASALVRVQKDMDDTLRALNGPRTGKQSCIPPGNTAPIGKLGTDLVNKSLLQIKEQYRSMREEWQLDKENRQNRSDESMPIAAVIQKEELIKKARDKEMKLKKEVMTELEDELRRMRIHNEEEKMVLDELEHALAKQKRRVEKQRRWSETQSQYRLCLEKMIRDTMHQCVVYKEQARLSQAACNALLARLESQKSACDAAELDLLKRMKHRESLEALVRPRITKRTRNIGHTDVGSCIKSKDGMDDNTGKTRDLPQQLGIVDENGDEPGTSNNSLDKDPDDPPQILQKPAVAKARSDMPKLKHMGSGVVKEKSSKDNEKQHVREDNGNVSDAGARAKDKEDPVLSFGSGGSGIKRKALELSSEMDVVLLGYEYGGQGDTADCIESVGDNAAAPAAAGHDGELIYDEGLETKEVGAPEDKLNQKLYNLGRTKDDEQLDELLHEVLEMQGKVNAAMADAIEDEEGEDERVKRLGKLNLDRWLQRLLLSPDQDEEAKEEEHHTAQGDEKEGGKAMEARMQKADHSRKVAKELILHKSEKKAHCRMNGVADNDREEQGKGGIIGGLLRKLSSKHDGDGVAAAGDSNVAAAEDVKDCSKPSAMMKSSEKNRIISPWRRRSSSTSGTSFKRCDASPWRRKSSESRGNKEDGNGRERSKASSKGSAEERRMIESFTRLRLDGRAGVAADGEKEEGKVKEEEERQIECEMEFVEKMRAARERERRFKMRQAQLQDLMIEPSSSSSAHHRPHPPPPARRRTHHRPLPAEPEGGAEVARAPASRRRRSSSTPAVRPHPATTPLPPRRAVNGAAEVTVRHDGEGAALFTRSVSIRAAAPPLMLGAGRSKSSGRTRREDAAAIHVAEPAGHVSFLAAEGGAEHDGLRASLSHAWKKAVKKFDLYHVPPQHH